MSTLAQFRSSVAGEVGLLNTVAGDQGQIDLWVNQGVTDVMLRTNCRVRCANLTLTAGTSNYTLPTSVLKIMTADQVSSGINYQLDQTSLEDILAMRRASSAYVSPSQYYAVEGSDLFLIYPTPALSSDTVTFYYVPRPATLSVSSDSPSEIPSEFHPLVEYYAFYRAATYTDDSSSQGGQAYLQRYEMLLKQMKRDVGLKGNHRLPRASVRSARQLLPFHDRSTYPGGSY